MERFYGYHPRQARLGFLAGAGACLGLCVWAASNAYRDTEPYAVGRLGISLGLFFAFVWALWRLRPREGWGITLSHAGLKVIRPFSGDPLELPWSAVVAAQRLGPKRGTLALRVEGGGQLLIARHLFESEARFDELCQDVSSRLPASRYDA